MVSLRDLIQAKNPEQEKIRKQSEDFQKQYAPDTEGDAPEEGIEESSTDEKPLIGPTGEPVLSGALPWGPTGGAGLAAEVEAEAETLGPSAVRKLMDKGYTESQINEGAENMRQYGSHTFTDAAGKPMGTVGESSPLGKELKKLGRDRMNASNNAAPVLKKP